MHVLRLSLNSVDAKGTPNVIICICRGKSEQAVRRAIDGGATTVRELQLCGIGDQCGSCHTSLRSMLAQAAAASAAAAPPCPACAPLSGAALASASA